MIDSPEGFLGAQAVDIPLLVREIVLQRVAPLSTEACPLPSKRVAPDTTVTVRCDPKEVWSSWMHGFIRPVADWRVAPLELMLDVKLRFGSVSLSARALIDTGARIPLVFQRGLVPASLVKPARFPVRFSTASGDAMEGGSTGLMLRTVLPVWSNGEKVLVKTSPLFAYEACLSGCDVILGYPFLKAFRLLPDPVNDQLLLQRATVRTECPAPFPPRLDVDSDTMGVSLSGLGEVLSATPSSTSSVSGLDSLSVDVDPVLVTTPTSTMAPGLVSLSVDVAPLLEPVDLPMVPFVDSSEEESSLGADFSYREVPVGTSWDMDWEQLAPRACPI